MHQLLHFMLSIDVWIKLFIYVPIFSSALWGTQSKYRPDCNHCRWQLRAPAAKSLGFFFFHNVRWIESVAIPIFGMEIDSRFQTMISFKNA